MLLERKKAEHREIPKTKNEQAPTTNYILQIGRDMNINKSQNPKFKFNDITGVV